MFYIYLILNKLNGKTYIGQHKSSNWQDRYMGSGSMLKRARKKYGSSSFEKFLIQYCYNQDEANEAEIYWIAEYRKRGKAEYNISDGGCNYDHNKRAIGYHHTEEAKKRIGDYWRGRKRPKSFGEMISKNRKGCKLSEEHKEKLRLSHIGKKASDETKRKMSEARKGFHHTEETKRKMSESKMGHPVSDEARRKMSEAKCGKEGSFKGHHHTDEAKKKMSAAKKNIHWRLLDGKRIYYREDNNA